MCSREERAPGALVLLPLAEVPAELCSFVSDLVCLRSTKGNVWISEALISGPCLPSRHISGSRGNKPSFPHRQYPISHITHFLHIHRWAHCSGFCSAGKRSVCRNTRRCSEPALPQRPASCGRSGSSCYRAWLKSPNKAVAGGTGRLCMFSLLFFGKDGHTGCILCSVKLKGSVYFFFLLTCSSFSRSFCFSPAALEWLPRASALTALLLWSQRLRGLH